jgi:4-hydroxy-4-methyl-2-oxoglutarate aldolase
VNDDGLPPTTALADVLLIREVSGVLSPPLRQFTTLEERVGGPARTVQLAPAEAPVGSLERLYALLDEDLGGAVIVVAGAEEIGAAVWGQILSRAARRAGAAAALVGGDVRDRPELTGEGLPVWAVGVAQVVAVDESVTIGDTAVELGDTIVVDPCGVVALPAGDAAGLLEAARDLTAGEEALLTELEGSTALTRAYAHKQGAVSRLRDADRPSCRRHHST